MRILRTLVVLAVLGTAAPGGSGCGGDDGAPDDAAAEVDAALEADADAPPDVPAEADVVEEADEAGEADALPDAVDVADDADAGDWLVPPAVRCAPSGDPCAAATVPGVWASYRKDFYYPFSRYAEDGPLPEHGGRFHVAAVSAVTGEVTGVRLNGTPAEDLLGEPTLEWWHVWPRVVTAGEPVWLAFHSRDPTWDAAGASGTFEIATTAGVAASGTFPAALAPVPLTYVALDEDYRTLLVHLKNGGAAPHELARLVVNGRDVTDVACVPETVLEPGETALWTVPLCAPLSPGSAWTVVAEFAGAPAAVGVGRVVRPFFPFESWPNTDECPFPTVNDEYFRRHQAAGLDTTFFYVGGGSACGGYDALRIVNEVAPATPDFHLLVADDFLRLPDPGSALTDTSRVAAFLTGDESDGEVYGDGGVPNPSRKAAEARELWSLYPEIPVYNGAKTNKNVGTFAGMCDIQGIDFYVAACAPHITRWGTHPPIRAAYDYLVNARNNHMPGTTWMYAQGLHQGWNKTALIGGATIHVQPDPQEILVQALSVVAAGGKGSMWFQVNQEEAEHRPARWAAIAESNWLLHGVRPFLREGDITGLARGDATPEDWADDPAIVDLVRARRALVVPIINITVATAPTDVLCGAAFLSEAAVPHWVLGDAAPDVTLEIPDDFGVVELFEVAIDGDVFDPASRVARDVDFPVRIEGRRVTLEGVALSNTRPVRLVVLAADDAVRGEVLGRLRP
ncbi:MAG: hypothetical protein JXB32_01995 [Deltaproteobacteria bacterium]|nr:hypothetical protein [Deltaproteobacteria bacterium]